MSDHNNHNEEQHGKKPGTKREMSRRQFLSYTLGGAGGFMGAGIIIPMIRFAVDPVLQPRRKHQIGLKLSKKVKLQMFHNRLRFKSIRLMAGTKVMLSWWLGFPKTATANSLR